MSSINHMPVGQNPYYAHYAIPQEVLGIRFAGLCLHITGAQMIWLAKPQERHSHGSRFFPKRHASQGKRCPYLSFCVIRNSWGRLSQNAANPLHIDELAQGELVILRFSAASQAGPALLQREEERRYSLPACKATRLALSRCRCNCTRCFVGGQRAAGRSGQSLPQVQGALKPGQEACIVHKGWPQ